MRRRGVPRERVGAQRTVRPGGFLLVDGPPGSGKRTALLDWAERTGVAVGPPEGTNTSDPGVVAIRLHGDATDLERVRTVQRTWPHAVVALLSTSGWPGAFGESGLSPDAVISGSELQFTVREVVAWAHRLGLELDEAAAAAIHHSTGGLALAVARSVRAAAQAGEVTEAGLAQGCTAAVDHLLGSLPAAADTLLLTGRADPLSTAAMGALWACGPGTGTLRTLRTSGLIAERDGAGSLSLPQGYRDALRQAAEPRRDDLRAALARALQTLLQRGLLTDAITLGRVEPTLLHEALAPHWEHLTEVPVTVLLPALEHADARDPRIALAAARAWADRTHAGHTGALPKDVVDRAHALLGRAAEYEGENVRLMVRMLRATLDRATGDYEQAEREHALLAATTSGFGPVPAAVHLHAGLSALAVDHLPEAAHRFSVAQVRAREGGAPRLAHQAEDLETLMGTVLDDPTLWWRRSADRTHREGTHESITARAVALLDAVLRLDVSVTQALDPHIPAATSVQEPLALGLLHVQAEALGLSMLHRAAEALDGVLGVRAALAPRALSPFERRLLETTHAELLVLNDRAEEGLELLDQLVISDELGGRANAVLHLARARALLALGHNDDVVVELDAVVQSFSGRGGRFIVWSQVMLAVAHYARGCTAKGDHSLEAAFVAGERSVLLFPFARLGLDTLTVLLGRAEQLDLDDVVRTYVDRLTQAHGDLVALSYGANPLSTREQVLLEQLVHTGRMRELARTLHVTENTVKSQLRAVYRKLGATNRATALRMARQRRLLP
ncbi:ATP-, maltotriose-and DNA-dependent transcriptional regulator MalT [Ruania alba]|uniref:ATP-, maltotriose-and DNA-dependent transcriptional regulator MalT n=2 Tax=Ruania alba TaxID=648782 RepID=A0A1H5M4Z0_9MICO|nr:ATP-, maltotriose-and DNA-dependent transcriptional regulator MalT [Ruania alba]